MADTVELDHLIVGAGPVGLTAALLLADQGHECLVVERRSGPQTHPAAHVINARTLEIFRQLGMDMAAIDAIAKDPADAGHVNFVTKLNGRLIGRLPFERQGPECLAQTPTPLRNISQHRLEPILADAVRAAPEAELSYGTEWVSSTQDHHGVTSTLRNRTNGEELEVRTRFVLAADGAGSPVRKSLGINMVGPANLQSFVAVHVAANLRPLIADRLGVLHFVMDPTTSGTFVAHDVDREWVFMTGFDPLEETIDDYGPERCARIVRDAAGDADIDLEVLSIGSWHMSAQVAQRFREGRIFLIGDAAHRFPPTGGLGLNTGVADAHNLAWKLAAAHDGWADPAILDSYQTERQPVAGLNCEQSTANAFKMVTLVEALGMLAAPTTEQMHNSLDDPDQSERIAAAVADQATHFDMIGLQLGHVYADGAQAPRTGPAPTTDDPSHFDPRAEIGARLPHAWTDDGRSTLDLIAPTGLTLISFGAHDAWAAAAAGTGAPLTHIAVGAEGTGGTGITVDDRWRQRCELDGDGALLVRPDQHVAWRAHSSTAATADEIEAAIAYITGHQVA